MATGSPYPIPSGAIVMDLGATWSGRWRTVPVGSVGIPTDELEAAGFTGVTGEILRNANLAANARLDDVRLAQAAGSTGLAVKQGSPSIQSDNALTITDTPNPDGYTGTLGGDTGTGQQLVSYPDALVSLSFGADADGPITADYEVMPTGQGTLFTIVGPDGAPLGHGTITLSNGTPVVATDVTLETFPATQYEELSFTVDPDPSAPAVTLTDRNLDGAALELIAAQLRQGSGLDQVQATSSGRNVPWARRGVPLVITGLHDENGTVVSLPSSFLVQRLQLDVRSGLSAQQNVQRTMLALGWDYPALNVPGSVASAPAPSGNAQTFTDRGRWAPGVSYAEFDVVQADHGLTNVRWVAILKDRVSGWSFPAVSGSNNPFVTDEGDLAVLAEGAWVYDNTIGAWFGVQAIVTLTGAVSGQSLFVHDRKGVGHYLTYYPSVGRWTDTSTAPA